MINFFLLRMRLNGIKSISTPIELEFYNKILTSFNPELYRVKAIYGENGSGKTGIVTAVSIIKKIVLSRDYLRQVETQSLLAELINKKNNKLALEVQFAKYYEEDKDIDVYRYGIEISKVGDSYEITNEYLNCIYNYTKYKKEKLGFCIEEGVIKALNGTQELHDIVEKNTMNTLSEKSFVSRLVFMDEIADSRLFLDALAVFVFWITISTYLDEEDMHEMYLIMKMIRDPNKQIDDKGMMDSFVNRQINYLDSKGRDVVDKKNIDEYEKKVRRLEKFLKIYKHDLKSITIEKRDNGDNYICELILNYADFSVNREFESTGIKKLIKMFDCLANVDKGGIGFIDEMDSNLNDIYLCKMIEYFMYYGKGQLCFTTHNLDPMTVLKNNRNSIDFLSSDNTITSWKITGNAAPDKYYKNGMIEHSPFNVEPSDFIGMFGE
ncbi:MAG: ATP-binding protein [Cellulosilyticum sp.]|nr:ATP-binding protein [Cellulosilyticum sp.]